MIRKSWWVIPAERMHSDQSKCRENPVKSLSPFAVVLDVTQEFSSCVFSHIFQVIQLNSKVFDPLDPDSNIRIKPYFL
uniref:Transposase n=1 Tax=Brugia timori TaxID=42155 RepID=A0A0R3QYF6_9BILA